jgi:hypothetical protein
MGGTNTREIRNSRVRQERVNNEEGTRANRQQLEDEPVLNPKQMRQMIAKKKMEEKTRERSLRASNSSELSIPN